MSRRCADPVYRSLEQAADTEQRSNRCTDPEYKYSNNNTLQHSEPVHAQTQR
jgi:hypothetical protein